MSQPERGGVGAVIDAGLTLGFPELIAGSFHSGRVLVFVAPAVMMVTGRAGTITNEPRPLLDAVGDC